MCVSCYYCNIFQSYAEKKRKRQTAGNMDCYHGFIQTETTLQQALLDLRLFIQTECFVTVSSSEF